MTIGSVGGTAQSYLSQLYAAQQTQGAYYTPVNDDDGSTDPASPSTSATAANNLTGSGSVTLSTQMLQTLFDMIQGAQSTSSTTTPASATSDASSSTSSATSTSSTTASDSSSTTPSGSVTLSTQTLQALFDLLQNGDDSDPSQATSQQASANGSQGVQGHHHHHHHGAPPPTDPTTTTSTADASTTSDATSSDPAATNPSASGEDAQSTASEASLASALMS